LNSLSKSLFLFSLLITSIFISGCDKKSNSGNTTLKNYSGSEYTAYLDGNQWKKIENSKKPKSISSSGDIQAVLNICAENQIYLLGREVETEYRARLFIKNPSSNQEIDLECGQIVQIDSVFGESSYDFYFIYPPNSLKMNNISITTFSVIQAGNHPSVGNIPLLNIHLPDNDTFSLLGHIFYKTEDMYIDRDVDIVDNKHTFDTKHLVYNENNDLDLTTDQGWSKYYIDHNGYQYHIYKGFPENLRVNNDGHMYRYGNSDSSTFVQIPSFTLLEEAPSFEDIAWNPIVNFTEERIIFTPIETHSGYKPNFYQISLRPTLPNHQVDYIDIFIDADLVQENGLQLGENFLDSVKISFEELFSESNFTGGKEELEMVLELFSIFTPDNSEVRSLKAYLDIKDLPSGPAGVRPSITVTAPQ